MTHPRSPLGALFLSLLIPGAGSMYGGRPLKGSLFLACYLLSWILGLTVYPAVAMLIAIAVITIWSPIHGFKSARAWNLAHGIES